MVDAKPSNVPPFGLQLDANMTIDRVENGQTIGTVTISTEDDGSLKIASTGRMPSGSFQQLRQFREGLQLVAKTTQQAAIVEHNGERLASISPSASGIPKWSIRWWAALRYAAQKLIGRDG